MAKRYFKIEGTIEVKSDGSKLNNDSAEVMDIILEALEQNDAWFGGGIKEVDAEGNDLKE